MENATISDIIFALEQVKEMYGNKEVCQLSLSNTISEVLLYVKFMNCETHTIEVSIR